MEKNNIYLGNSELLVDRPSIKGQFVEIDGIKYYRIQNYHNMPDFFMSIVSDSDHWMFISSNGSLSAGRKNRDCALFPYYTDDKIHDYKGITGSSSIFLVEKDRKSFLWEPFTEESKNIYSITRNLYKSSYGNSIIFEEINIDLGVSFRYGWYNSEKFGFIKKSTLTNNTNKPVLVEVLDGLKNILPYGADYAFQNEYSNLLDAYKKNERVDGSSLGLYMLSSIPVDRAEPSEALRVNTVWSVGLGEKSKILISDKQISKFKYGQSVKSEFDIKASRGAYFIVDSIELDDSKRKQWYTIAELNKGSSDVANLNYFINNTPDLEDVIRKDIAKGTLNLKKMVSCADGSQLTNTKLCYARHYSNTLYNIMRGGLFANNYQIETSDFRKYLLQINRLVSKEHEVWLEKLPDQIPYIDIIAFAEEKNDADLLRITYEYLPLTFSRRHGDPSRPWNLFSIETKNEDGSTKYHYAGNWRDIFQNWEALCYSYPEFIEGIISKFLNASTIDGYNPYRIMRDGIDWESPDPDDPWSYIGYWGDHQIIYLQKMLELSNSFHPGKLDEFLTREIFTYANVPYQIKSYAEIIQNPKDTVVFNYELDAQIKSEVQHLGADARLLKNKAGDQLYKVNLTEKILITLLSKLSNFIPEAGIWLNTQRPEWNDANNALVGNGASMVTLYYLRRFIKFWNTKLSSTETKKVDVSEELGLLFESIRNVFKDNIVHLEKGFTDNDRNIFTELLGQSHSKFRNEIYNYSFSGEKTQLKIQELIEFTEISLKFIDQSIKKNKRRDGLYHSYNLISIKEDSISIRNLYEMLEGQVAILSSGFLSIKDSLKLLDSLKKSQIYRDDQYSYMLYPDRQLPRFMDKNIIPEKLIKRSTLLKKFIEDGESSIIKADKLGNYHFTGSFRNSGVLESALDELRVGSYSSLIEKEKELILDIYERVFDHQSFTGRSGTFYGYEGLGSIYWHMVSKLMLATQEVYFKAVNEGAQSSVFGKLKDHYYEIKAGIGLYKSPELYGAFPTDAYSHTPMDSGVKQPGLTGQVKEDIISRIGEMGVVITEGKISFKTELLNKKEILESKQVFEYYSIDGDSCQIELNKNQLGFTFCQVPIVYTLSDSQNISISFNNGYDELIEGNTINEEYSKLIFSRTGDIKLIEVTLKTKENVG